MFTTTITNPRTNRPNRVRAWKIEPRKVYEELKGGNIHDARDVSYSLLNDKQSLTVMEAQQYGDAAERNFALAVFEQALDWRLGLAVLDYMRCCRKQGKLPKPFTLCVTRGGEVYIQTFSGKLIQM